MLPTAQPGQLLPPLSGSVLNRLPLRRLRMQPTLTVRNLPQPILQLHLAPKLTFAPAGEPARRLDSRPALPPNGVRAQYMGNRLLSGHR